MTEPSLDTYPGGVVPVHRDPHPVDGFIFRHANKLLTNRVLDAMAGQTPEAPPHGTPQSIEDLNEGLQDIGVDPARITVGVAIAQLGVMRRFRVPNAAPCWTTGPEDYV